MNTQDIIVTGLFIAGLIGFFMGFHSIDNAWNLDSACWDMALDGESKYTKSELYRHGWQQMFNSLLAFFLSFIISVIRVKKKINIRIGNN